jgi:hypothetical protein
MDFDVFNAHPSCSTVRVKVWIPTGKRAVLRNGAVEMRPDSIDQERAENPSAV